MFYLFLVILGLAALGVYVTLMLHLVPGAAEERLGVLEELPPGVGTWKTDATSPAGAAAQAKGLTREIRVLHQLAAGWFGSERLVRQVRYRNASTNEIVHVDPEEVTKRRRVKR